MLSILPRTLKSIEALRAGTPGILTAYARNEQSDPRALRTLQDERLRALVAHAAEHVPFWKRRFARYGIRPTEVRSIGDLAALPPLDPRDVSDFGDELLTGGEMQPGWFPSHALMDRERLLLVDLRARRERVADELRHITWMGLDWRTPRAVLVGRDEHGDVLEATGGRLRASLRSGVWCHPARADENRIRAFSVEASRAGAELLSGPPSALERVADAIETGAANGKPPFRPRAVQSWGECLSKERREKLENALGAPVHDSYRTRETGEIAHECRERDGLHLSMERAIVEFVRGGERVPDGDDGEMLVTVLDNIAQPLFRYRIGDIGCRIPRDVMCACGRTSERILLSDGRIDALVTTPAGRRIHSDWFDWLFEDVPGALDWRVTQEDANELGVRVVRGVTWNDAAEGWIRDSIMNVDRRLTVRFDFADVLPAEADGRRRRVVSHVAPSWNEA